jgi:hypothetical protein
MGVAYIQATIITIPSVQSLLHDAHDNFEFLNAFYEQNGIVHEQSAPIILILFFFVFTPQFLRILFGDSRYLDLHYGRSRVMETKQDYIDFSGKISSGVRFWDIVYIFLMASQFVALGQLLVEPYFFSLSLTLIVGINVIFHIHFLKRTNRKSQVINAFNWSALTKPITTMEIYQTNQRVGPIRRRDRVLVVWVYINAFTLFILLSGLIALHGGYITFDVYISLVILVSLFSTIYDLIFCWRFYFPRFNDLAHEIRSAEFRHQPLFIVDTDFRRRHGRQGTLKSVNRRGLYS